MAATIIHSVLVFDGRAFQRNLTVTFSAATGLITAVSKDPFDRSLASHDTTIIDGTGHTLLPGLIEAHMHAHDLHLPPGADSSQVLKTPLKCGITTVCDMFSDPATVNSLRAEVRKEVEQVKASNGSASVTMSDLKSCLYGATIEGGWPKPIVLGHHPSDETKAMVAMWPNLTTSTAAAFIKSNKSGGADYIKLMQEDCCSMAIPTGSIPSASLDLQKAVVTAAHAEDMLVVGHATSVKSTEIILNSGADGLTHTFIDQPPTDSVIGLYKKTKAFVIPTLVVLASITNEAGEQRQQFADVATKKGLIDDFTRQNMLDVIGLKADTASLEYAYESVRQLKKEGIDVVAGTDSVMGLKGTAIGPSLWMELDMYVKECGMSIEEALAAATGVSAERLRFTDRGKVETGRRGDLLLINGELSQGLEGLWQDVVGVWKEGIRAV